MGVVYPRKTDFQSPSVDQFVNNYLQHYAKMTGVNDTVCWNQIYPPIQKNPNMKKFDEIEDENIKSLVMSEIENMVKRHKKYPTGHMVDAISYINYFMDQDYINKINKVNDKVELDMNKISLKIEDEQFSYSNVPRPSQVYFIFRCPVKDIDYETVEIK